MVSTDLYSHPNKDEIPRKHTPDYTLLACYKQTDLGRKNFIHQKSLKIVQQEFYGNAFSSAQFQAIVSILVPKKLHLKLFFDPVLYEIKFDLVICELMEKNLSILIFAVIEKEVHNIHSFF